MRGDLERLVGQLRALGVDIKHVNHQMIVSNCKITVEKTGIVLT